MVHETAPLHPTQNPPPTHPPRFPTATHKDLAEKLYASPLCQGSARFKRPKLSQTAFTIDHYAGGGAFGLPGAPPLRCRGESS